MTFKQLWTTIRTAWQSRPLAIIIPVVALFWFWWHHGHLWVVATVANGGSLPDWQTFVMGAGLLTAKWERITEFLFGVPPAANMPAPVTSPALVAPAPGPGDGPKAALVLILGLSLLGVSSCAHVTPIVHEIEQCAGPAASDIATKILPAAEVILECELATGVDPVALPACASNGLAALAAAAGPDGWRIVACVVDAIEHDVSKPEALRVRAAAGRKLAARKLAAP